MKITIRDSKYRIITPEPLDIEGDPIRGGITYAWGEPSDPTVVALGRVDPTTGACAVTAVQSAAGKSCDVVVTATDSSVTPPKVVSSTLTFEITNSELGALTFKAGDEVDSGTPTTPPATPAVPPATPAPTTP